MSRAFENLGHAVVRWQDTPGGHAVVRVGLVVLVAALVLGIAEAVFSMRHAIAGQVAAAVPVEPVAAEPAAELPREWQWRRDAVTFDSMFRQPREQ